MPKQAGQTDMDGLAQSLVCVAAYAIREAFEPGRGSGRRVLKLEDWIPEARAAASATLHVLADTMPDGVPAQIWGPVELRALADLCEEVGGRE